MTTLTKARLLFVQTSAEGKSARQPIDIKITVKAESGFNYTVVDELSSRPPAKMILRRSGDSLIIEQDGTVVSEVENFYGEKAVTFTTDGSASLTGSSSYVTPMTTPIGPLPGGDKLIWANDDNSALIAGLEAEHGSIVPFFLIGLVAGALGGGSSSPAAGPGPVVHPEGGFGLVTDDGIGGATVTVKYFNAAGVLVATDTVLTNDDPTSPAFGSFKVDLAGLGYDRTGFITATAVGGRDVNGNALNGAVVYQVLVTDALIGDVDAGDEYQIVLSPLTTVLYQSVLSNLGVGLGDSESDMVAALAGAGDLNNVVSEAAHEIASLFGLGAYGADPLTLLTTASDFDPTRQSVERQVNLLLVALSSLGSGLTDGDAVDSGTLALATGASSAAALSLLDSLQAARVLDEKSEFSAGDRTLVQAAVVNFLNTVDDVAAVAAITKAGGNADGLRADGGDATDSSTARIAAAIAGLGTMIAQGGEQANLALTLIAGGDLMPSGRTSLADLFATAFERAVDPDRDAFAADLEFDPSELSGGSSAKDVFILDGVNGTDPGAEPLDTFSADLTAAVAEVYAKGDFASVVIKSDGAFLDLNRDSVLSSEDADGNANGSVDDLTAAVFSAGGNASLAQNAVTIIYSDTATDNDRFQADADPLAAITKDDRIEVRVQNYDYSSGTYGCGDVSANAQGIIGANELQYILDKGDVTLAGVSVLSVATVPGTANLILGGPDAPGDALAMGTMRSIFVDAHGDASQGNIAQASALVAFNGEVTGATFVETSGQSADASLIVAADSELTLRTLGALAGGDDSHVHLAVGVGSDATLTVTGNLLVNATGYAATVGGFSRDLSDVFGDQASVIQSTAFIGGSGDVTLGGFVTVKASGTYASTDVTIGASASGSITFASDVLVEADGLSADATLSIGAALSSGDQVEVSFGGALEVIGSGMSSEAQLNLVNASTSIDALEVRATGVSSYASADLNNVSASVGTYSIEATGTGSHAGTYVHGSSDVTVDALTVTASGVSSEATAYFGYSEGDTTSLTLNGDLNITATSYDASAYVQIGSYDASVNFDGTHIEVSAVADSSSASAEIYNASGTVDGITVTAGAPDKLTSFFNDSFELDGSSDTSISDGSNDAYDGGNYISTTGDSADAISYNVDTVVADTFGAGSERVVVFQGGLFGLMVDGNSEGQFSIGGNLGADGSGTEDLVELGAYGGYTAFAQRTYGAGDPSINRIFLYQTLDGVTVSGPDGNSNTDEFTVTGLADVDRYGYFVAYGSTDQALDAAQLQTMFESLVDGVMGADDAAGMRDAFYSTYDALAGEFVIQSNGSDQFASADIRGSGSCGDTLTVNGDITITASGSGASADLKLGNAVLNDVTVSVDATGVDSYAGLSAYNGITGTINTITVTASGNFAIASADIEGIGGCGDTLTVNGDVNVTASALSSEAYVYMQDVVLDGSAVTVTASGTMGSADLVVDSASGTISEVTVLANGANGSDNYAFACADISAASYDTLTIEGDVSATATGTSSEAFLYVSGATFGGGSVTASATAQSSDTHVSIDAATGLIANITVTASGLGSAASVDVMGVERTSEVQGFDIFGLAMNRWNNVDFVAGTTIDVTADGVSFTYTLTSDDVTAFSSDFNFVLDNLTQAATNAGLTDFTLQIDGQGNPGLYIVYNDGADHEMASITVTDPCGDTYTFNDSMMGLDAVEFNPTPTDPLTVYGGVSINASGVSSDATLLLSNAVLAVDGVSVTASGARSYASADLSNDIGNVGTYTLEASGTNSYAGTYVHGSSDVTATSLTVTASGESSDAEAYFGYYCGDTTTLELNGDLTVSATSYDASAYVQIGSYDASVNFNGTNIVVSAAAASSSASAEIYNAHGTVGNVTVQALAVSGGSSEWQGFDLIGGGYLSNAGVAIEVDTVVSVTVDGQELSYTLTAEDVAAYVCGDISGLLAALNTQAVDLGVGASFSGEGPMGSGLFISYSDYTNHALATVTVTDACGDAYTFGNSITSTRYITNGSNDAYDDGNFLSTTGNSIDAISYQTEIVVADDFGVGSERVVVYQDAIFGLMVTGNTESEFHVTGGLGADGSGSEDILDLGNYGGFSAFAQRTYGAGDPSINRIFIFETDGGVTGNSLDGNTNNDDFTITGLSSVGTYGYFVAYGANDTALDQSQLTDFFARLVDNVLTAGSGSAADMRDAFHSNFTNLTDVLPALHPDFQMDGSGDVQYDYIESDGSSASANNNAYLRLSGDAVVEGVLTVQALGTGSVASADLNGIVFAPSGSAPMIAPMSFVSGDAISVDPTNYVLSTDVMYDILTGGSFSFATVGVEASGLSSEATLHAYNASGTINGINVTASGNFATASADIYGIGGCGDTLTVNGDVNVTASALSSEAHVYLRDVVLDGSTLTVTASGVMGSADLVVDSASGTIGDISVLASGANGSDNYAFACADISAASLDTLTINGDMSVTASGTSSEAFLYVEGAVLGGGSLTASATAQSSDAHVSIDAATGSIENITLTASGLASGVSVDLVGGDTLTVGGSVSVTASGNMASADLYLANAVLDNVTVSVVASGNSSEAAFNAYNGISGTIDGITVTASGDNNDGDYGGIASADIEGSVNCGDASISVSGAITITASGISSEADLYLSDATLAVSSVTVSASELESYASAELSNVSGTLGAYTLNASGTNSYVGTYVHGSSDVTADSLSVTASGESSEANAYFGYSVDDATSLTLNGNLSVTANSYDASAYAQIASHGSATLNGTHIAVAAAGNESNASADIYNASGTVEGITVRASGNWTDASADIYGNGGDALTVSGTVAVTASSNEASANLYLEDAVLDNVTVSVVASGNSSEAAFNAYNGISGTIDGITVTASGDNNSGDYGGFASADIEGSVNCGDVSLSVSGAITITASGISSEADLYLSDATLSAGNVTINASGLESYASAELYNVSGTVGAYSLNASGTYSYVGTYVHGSSDVTADSLSVTASGESSEANAYFGYYSGDATSLTLNGDLTITANSYDASAYVQIGSYDASVAFNGTHIAVAAAGNYSDASAEIYTASGTVDGIVVRASGQSADASADIYGSASCGDTLTVSGTVSVTASSNEAFANLYLENAVLDNVTVSVVASGNSSEAAFNAYNGISGTIDGITVTASGDNNSGDYGGFASADIEGSVNCGDASISVSGAITITASGTSSEADLYLSDATLAVSNVTVTASELESYASAELSNVSGTLGAYTLNASGTYSYVGTYVHGSSDVTATSLSVTASGESSEATAYFGYYSGDATSLTLNGDLTITANSYDASAYVQIGSYDASVAFNGTHIAVAAAGNYSDASAEIYTASGTVDGIVVRASGQSADASADIYGNGGDALTVSGTVSVTASSNEAFANLYLENAVLDNVTVSVVASGNSSEAAFNAYNGISGTIDGITVTASGDNNSGDYGGFASADIEGSTNCGDASLSVSGAITITASGISSEADLYLSDATLAVSNVTVTASELESYASAELSNVSGTVGAYSLNASGTYSYVGTYVHGSSDVTADSLSVTASGESSDAEAYFGYSESDNTSLTLNGDLTITANSYDASAYVQIGSYDASVAFNGTHVSVLAVANSSAASAEIYTASGTIDGIVVRASGQSADASADIYGSTSCGDTLTVGGTVSVTASSNEASADLYLQDAVLNNVTVSVAATGNSSDAGLAAYSGISGTINGITVTAGSSISSPFLNDSFELDGMIDTYISNGDDDAYDGGNYISTTGDSADAISYSVDTVVADTFGAGSERVVVYQQGMFGLMVDGNSEGQFSVNGDLGADGYGTEDIVQLGEYGGYTAFAQRTYNAGDASINRVFVYQTAGGVAASQLDGNTNTDDFTVTGLADVGRYGYFVVYGSTDQALTEAKLQSLFESIVDGVMGEADAAAMRDAFNSGYSALAADLVIESHGSDQYASADIQGSGNCGDTLTVNGDITVLASGFSAEAHLQLHYAVLNDSAITVTASGTVASADLSAYYASGTISEITVLASGGAGSETYAFACADITATCDDILTIQGNVSLTASGTSSEAFLYVDGAVFAGGNVTLRSTGRSSDTFASIDVATGTLGDISLLASGRYSDTSADINFAGSLVGDIHVSATGWSSEASLSMTASSDTAANLIVLGECVDVTVTASGYSSEAYLNLDHLSGVIQSVTVSATGGASFDEDGTIADAMIRFDADDGGHVASALIETGAYGAAAADAAVSSMAVLRLSQTVFCGDVTVTGDGFATLVIRSEDVKTVDLTGLRSDADDHWGVFNLDFAKEDRNLSASAFNANNVMTITGFDVSRDAVNNSTPIESSQFDWGYEYYGCGDVFYAEDESTVFASFANLASTATEALDNRGAKENPGYFFGTYGGDGYLFYDRSAYYGNGLTDVVKLEGVTSFSAINVAERVSADLSYTTGCMDVVNAVVYEDLYYGRQNYYSGGNNYLGGSLTMDFSSARIEGLDVQATGTGSYLTVQGSSCGDIAGDLMFRQAEITVSADVNYGSSADASLFIRNAVGTIDHINVFARSYGYSGDSIGHHVTANATASALSDSHLEIRELTVGAGRFSSADADFEGLSGSVQQVTLSVSGDVSYANVYLGVSSDVLSHIERIDFIADGSYSGDVGGMSLSTYQGHGAVGVNGGEVYARAYGSGDVSVSLNYYGGGRAGEIHLGGDAGSLFNFDRAGELATDFSGDVINRTFNLELDIAADQDLDIADDKTQLLDERMQIWGSDLGTQGGDDTIRFTFDWGNQTLLADFGGDSTPVATMDDFLSNAEAALNGTVDYYFGVVDTDGSGGAPLSGYLAYDADGTGITMLIEFHDMTDFDQSRLNMLAPA